MSFVECRVLKRDIKRMVVSIEGLSLASKVVIRRSVHSHISALVRLGSSTSPENVANRVATCKVDSRRILRQSRQSLNRHTSQLTGSAKYNQRRHLGRLASQHADSA